MTRKRCTGKVLGRTATADAEQLYLAEFTGDRRGLSLAHVEAASAAFSAKRY